MTTKDSQKSTCPCGSRGALQIEEKQTGAVVFNLSGQLATLRHAKVNVENRN